VKFEPAIPAIERLQTHALNRAVTDIDVSFLNAVKVQANEHLEQPFCRSYAFRIEIISLNAAC
jgi:hypothetical protein